MSKLPIQIRRELVTHWPCRRVGWELSAFSKEKRRSNRAHRRAIGEILARVPEQVWRLDLRWNIYWSEFYSAATASPPSMTTGEHAEVRDSVVRKLTAAAQALESNSNLFDPSLLNAICGIHGLTTTSAETERKARIRRVTDWHVVMNRIHFDASGFSAFSRPDLYGIEAFNAWKSPRLDGLPKSALELLFYLDVPLSDLIRSAIQEVKSSAHLDEQDEKPTIRASNPQSIHSIRYEKLRDFFLKHTGGTNEKLVIATLTAFADAEKLPLVDIDRVRESERKRAKRAARNGGTKKKKSPEKSPAVK